jgi:hypothetical protein
LFLQIGKKNWDKALQVALEYEKNYVNKLKMNDTTRSFFYEALADIYFGKKDFSKSADYYLKADKFYKSDEFMIKYYHSLIFKVRDNQNYLSLKQQEEEILKIIAELESFFDNTQNTQTKTMLASILSQAYAITSQITSKECYMRSSNLYSLFKDVIRNQPADIKNRVDSIKDQLKNQSDIECGVKNNQTNNYLVKLINDNI